MGSIIFGILLFAIPALLFTFLIISIIFYVSGIQKNKKNPGSVPAKTIQSRKIALVISAILSALVIVIVIGFVAMMYMAIAYM